MRDSLFAHYERELSFFRRHAEEFARRHPATAGALLLREAEVQDPHVERLIEAFSLIAGRIHQRLDDEYPELTQGLLETLYPHYLAPVPSMAVVELELDPARAQHPDGLPVERGTQMRSRPVGGLACKYRTCYPVRLWPVEVQRAEARHAPFPPGLAPPPGTRLAIRIELGGLGGLSLSRIRLDSLQFFLSGPIDAALDLYELILNRVISVTMTPIERGVRGRPLVRRADQCLAPVGFGPDEGLLPYSERSFPGYRLLTELFAFPAKFLFFELRGLNEAFRAAGEGDLEVALYIDAEAPNLEMIVDRRTFRMGCTPVVNLFDRACEPIRMDHTWFEHPVTPDVAHPTGMEIYRVNSVRGIDAAGVPADYKPLYGVGDGPSRPKSWVASRRASARPGDGGTDVYLTLVDPHMDPARGCDATLVVQALCTNRDLPLSLIQSGQGPGFQLESAGPRSEVHCLLGPTVPFRPPMGRATHWQLISHLSLNYLSIASEPGGLDAFRQLLGLYRMFLPPDAARYPVAGMARLKSGLKADAIIAGITGISSRRGVAYLRGETASGFCRGVDVTLEFDAEAVAASEAFFLGAVLDQFLGLYASINSFSRLSVKFRGSAEVVKQWVPRAGNRTIL